jgi:uncharacterized protein
MILTLYVKPSSQQEKIEWIDNDTAKIWVKAPPEKGRANKAVIELVANEFSIPKTSVELIRGGTAKIKQVKILK